MGLARRTDDRRVHLVVETDGRRYWAIGSEFEWAKAKAAKAKPNEFRRIVVRVDADVLKEMGIRR